MEGILSETVCTSNWNKYLQLSLNQERKIRGKHQAMNLARCFRMETRSLSQVFMQKTCLFALR